MGICSYHEVTFSTPYLTFPQLASFQWIEGKEDVSVQTKCHCPQLSTCTQNDLTSKSGITTKSRMTWDNLNFSKSQTNFLSLGTKAKVLILKFGSVHSIWLGTALPSLHSKRCSNCSRNNKTQPIASMTRKHE